MDLKEKAALKALDFVQSGMNVGLGTGSTTAHFTRMLGEKISKGALENISAVSTSDHTSQLAFRYGIPLTTLDKSHPLHLAVDGADEIDPNLNLIKGLGKALLREKIVESQAELFIVIADDSKKVSRLGTKGPLPVEIVKFEANFHVKWLRSICSRAELWSKEDGTPVVTDNGNYLVRCWFENADSNGIVDPYILARVLADQPGIIEHGLFLDMADKVIIAGSGGILNLERSV